MFRSPSEFSECFEESSGAYALMTSSSSREGSWQSCLIERQPYSRSCPRVFLEATPPFWGHS